MNVMAWSDRQVERFDDFEALRFGKLVWTQRESHSRTAGLAGHLLEKGLAPGDPVALWGCNGPALLHLASAVIRAGGVAVILDEQRPAAEVERILDVLKPLLRFSSKPVPGWLSLDDFEPAATVLEVPVPRDETDPAQIVFSSGTTGEPKGVVWSHGTVAARYLDFADGRPAGALPRRSLCALPLSMAFGTQYLYLRLLQKMTLVLMERFEPSSFLEQLKEHRVQTTMLVPSLAEALLAEPVVPDLPSWKSCLVGGAPVSPTLVKRLRQRFGVRAEVVYGLTELGPVARGEEGLGSPGGGLEVRLEGAPVGEILVRAGRRRALYLGQAEAEEWFATGDLGYWDAAGKLQFAGRKDDLILQGGTNVYPRPLEEFLGSLEGVEDVAVVGLPNPYLGQEVVAWVVGEGHSPVELLGQCRRRFEARALPARIVMTREIPRTAAGKVDRGRLRERAVGPAGLTSRKGDLEEFLDRTLERLGLPAKGKELPLELDSLGAIQLSHLLGQYLGRRVEPTLLFSHPTIEALVWELQGEASVVAERLGRSEKAVAIVGVGCRLPGGVESASQFWEFLNHRGCSVAEIERWPMDSFYHPEPGRWGKSYVRRASMVEADLFDAEFFGMGARQAGQLDPQQRLLLEAAWHAFEDGGLTPRVPQRRNCGVFVGLSPNGYESHDPLGAAPSMAAGRLSHFLNLGGPSLALDTACSSALVAVYEAVQALRSGACRWALAGGVHVIGEPRSFVGLSQMRVLSPDGLCKSFDAAADGFGRGEGCVLFLLKLLEHVGDQDRVLAVIRGGAVNNDGRSQSLTAPNGAAQQEVMRAALSDAAVTDVEIDYWEAHGSGTPLGDAIELEAGRAVLSDCVLGSVKTNVGHLEAASGGVGLLKAALVVARGQVPPHLHLTTPVSELGGLRFDSGPLGVGPHRALVTSLGMSGTNACLVLESAPNARSAGQEKPTVLCLSAPRPEVVGAMRSRVGTMPSAGACRTSQTGRNHFPFRAAWVGDEGSPLQERTPSRVPRTPKVALMFTGQGAPYAGAGCELYEEEPVFRQALDRCQEILQEPLLDWLRTGTPETARVQPALFALEWSLVQLWGSWGVVPDLVLGHSLGEYVAACVAGIFSLEEGLRLVAHRGRLMARLKGGMRSLTLDEAATRELIAGYPELSIAALNTPKMTVISGAEAALDALEARARKLVVSGAFHSPLCDPLLAPFEEMVSRLSLSEPSLEMVSTVNDRPDWTSAAYWVQGLRGEVRFLPAMQRAAERGVTAFLEVGPHPVLTALGQRCVESEGWVASLRQGEPEVLQMRRALARLYELGINPDWEAVGNGGKGELPLYPFQRTPYWTSARAWGALRPELEVEVSLKDRVRTLVAGALGVGASELDAGENLLDRGFDSLKILEFLAEIQRELGARLDPEELLSHPTLTALTQFLERRNTRQDGLVRLSEGEGVPVICAPPAGGRVSAYARLPEWFSGRPVLALDGRRERGSLKEMARSYTQVVGDRLPEGAVAVLGWSLGGLLAYEVACQLESRGRVVDWVAMLDPPDPLWRGDLSKVALRALVGDLQPGAVVDEQLDPEEAVGALGLPWEEERFQHYLEQLQAVADYRPGSLKARVWVWWARAAEGRSFWEQRGVFRSRQLEVDHYQMISSEVLARICEELRSQPGPPSAGARDHRA